MTDATRLGAVVERDLQLERQQESGERAQEPLRRNQGNDDS
jgi:hypothetical protein